MLGFLEGGAGGTGAGRPDPPAGEPEAIAVGGDHDGLGMGEGDVDRLDPAAVDDDGGTDEAVEQRLDVGAAGPDVTTEGLTLRRRRAQRAGGAEGEDRSAQGLAVQGTEGAPAGVDAVDDHGGQGLTGGGLEGGLPAGVDLDQVEHGAEHAVDAGQPLGAGTRPGLVEGEGEGLDPRLPRVLVALGPAVVVLGRRRRRPRRRPGAARPPSMASHERHLGRLGRHQLAPQALGLDGEPLDRLGQRVGPAPHPVTLAPTALGGGAEGGQLAAHLGGGPGGGGHTGGPLGLEVLALGGQRSLGAGQLGRLGLEPGGLGLDVDELLGQSGGFGLERGHDALVDGRAPGPLDATTALGEHRGEATGLLEERLVLGQAVAEIVAAHGRELGLGGHHLGVELGQRPTQARLLGGELGPTARALLEAGAQAVELPAGGEDAQGLQLGHHAGVAPGRVGLALERPQLAAHLAEEVLEAGEVALGGRPGGARTSPCDAGT